MKVATRRLLEEQLVVNAVLGSGKKSDAMWHVPHPISPKTPVPQYQPKDRNKRKGKRVEDYSRDRAAQANKKALALLLKPESPTPSNTLQYRVSKIVPEGHRDGNKSLAILRGSAADRCISVPMCDQNYRGPCQSTA